MTQGEVDVHSILEEEFEAVCSHLPGRQRVTHRSRLDEQRSGRFVYLIAWVDGVPAGHVGIGFPDDRRVADRCEWRDLALVSDLWVEEAFRGRGGGRALMVELERRCREAGMEGIGLDSGVHEGYAAARNLYRSLGYTDHGGAFISSEAMPPGAGLPYFVEILTIWTKSLRD